MATRSPRSTGGTEVAAFDLDGVLRRLRGAFVELIVASILINILALATPLFMMTVYNKVISHAALETLDVMAFGMLGLFAFDVALRALRGHVASRLGARLDVALGSELLKRTLELPLATLEALSGRGMADRLRQLDSIRGFFSSQLPTLLVDLAFVGLFLAALFVLAPTLALITLAAMAGFVLLGFLGARRQARLGESGARLGSDKAACLGEALGQALTVKALGLEQQVAARFERRLLDTAWNGFKAGSVAGTVGSLGQALQSLAALAIVYAGVRMIVSGELSIGGLVAASILSSRTIAPMRQVTGAWTQMRQAVAAFRALGNLRSALPGRAPDLGVRLKGEIRFEDVAFRYAPERPPAVTGLGLAVQPGAILAIVGPPGSGKSTLLRLLLGLERPEHGRVTIDGQDAASLPTAALRREIGVVPQEVQLFAGTIAENIAAGAASAAEDGADARIVAAAKFVGLHETIQALPAGYDTELGERGRGLSLGQRQLVTIARALYRNPKILVLDEATSALDLEGETLLLQNLRRASKGRTIVMVTHRRSVLTMCDRAVLLEGGKITAAGTPDEIAARLGQPRDPAAHRPPAHRPNGAAPTRAEAQA